MLMKTRDELWIIRLKFSEDLILSSTTSLFKRLPKKNSNYSKMEAGFRGTCRIRLNLAACTHKDEIKVIFENNFDGMKSGSREEVIPCS